MLSNRIRALVTLSLVLFLVGVLPLQTVHARVCLPSSNFAVSGGWFFSETGGDTDLGYVVFDDSQARFWEAFQSEGGVAALGYPVSQRFQFRGFMTQAFQKAILQWDPARDGINYFNTLDELHLLGLDDFLFNFRQIPHHAVLLEDQGLDPRRADEFKVIEENHLSILDADVRFREVFRGTQWRELYGLPISFQDFGPFQTVRTQRQVLQVFRVEGLGGAVGVVSAANAGDIAKEAGLIPERAAQPMTSPIDLGEVVEELTLREVNVAPGNSAVIRVKGVSGSLSTEYGGATIPGFCIAGSDTLLIPVSRSAQPGLIPVVINVALADGSRVLTTHFTVKPIEFDLSIINLPDDLVPTLDPALVAQENSILDAIYTNITPRQIWQGRFLWPLEGPISTPFGSDRIYEPGSVTGFHSGTDIVASYQSPVLAAQNGIVVFVGMLPIRGMTVILDHGWGIYTGYSHLAATSIQSGGQVFAGQTVGLVGSTGRSTGSHLHLELRVHNIPIDPVPWLTQDIFGS